MYRIELTKNPSDMLLLGQSIINKHLADGAGSPLSFLDMSDMANKVAAAKAKHDLSIEKNGAKEIAIEARDLALGIDANVIDTVDYYVKSSRDILLGYYKAREHELNVWGFYVNKTTGVIKIDLPRSAPKLIELAGDILAKNTIEGVNSPIKGLNIVDFTAKKNTAQTQHELSVQLNSEKMLATGERDRLLGIGLKQNLSNETTVRFYIISVRDVLLGLNKRNENALGLWGFTVYNTPKPKKIKASLKGTITDQNHAPLDGVTISVVQRNVSVESDSEGKYLVPVQPEGIYDVLMTKTNYSDKTFPGVEIKKGQVKTIDVQMIAIAGTLVANVISQGQPLGEAAVRIDALNMEGITNPEGIATLNGVAVGTWDVTATKTGYTAQTTPITMEANGIVNITFDLVPID